MVWMQSEVHACDWMHHNASEFCELATQHPVNEPTPADEWGLWWWGKEQEIFYHFPKVYQQSFILHEQKIACTVWICIETAFDQMLRVIGGRWIKQGARWRAKMFDLNKWLKRLAITVVVLKVSMKWNVFLIPILSKMAKGQKHLAVTKIWTPHLRGLQSQSTKQSLSFSVCPPDGAHPSLSIPPFSKLPTPTWWWRPGQWHCLACPRSYLPHVLISSCFLVFMSSWLPVIMSSYPQYSYHLCPHVLMSSYPPCPGQWHSHGPTHPRFCLLTTELPFCRCIKYEPIKHEIKPDKRVGPVGHFRSLF